MKSPKLYGGSIAYTLMISLLVSGLLSAFWLMQSHQQERWQNIFSKQLAMENLQSGLYLFCLEKKREELWKSDLFESQIDSFSIQTEPWGLYQIAHLHARHSQEEARKIALLGQAPTGYFAQSLFLSDHQQPLSLVGETQLSGKLHLPAAGVKAGRLGDQHFSVEKMPEGPFESSFLKKVDIVNPNLNWVKNQFFFETDETPKRLSLQDWELNAPWDEDAFSQQIAGHLQIEDCQISGKCIIRASHSITVSADAKLDMTMLCAPIIRIEHGFSGRIQAFATQKIILAERVKLSYPSVLFLIPRNKVAAQIILEESCEVAGGIGAASGPSFAQIEQGCHIKGHVWGFEQLELHGQVDGGVITDAFVVKTQTRSFQNFLLNAKIDFQALPTLFAMPRLQASAYWRKACWLGIPSQSPDHEITIE